VAPGPRPPRGGLRERLWAALPILVMALVLGAYALVHSPLGQWLERSLGARPGCLSVCSVSALADMAAQGSAFILIAAALLGAAAVASALRLRGLESAIAFGLLAFALISVPAALVGGIGDLLGVRLLRPPYGPLLASLPALSAIVLGLRSGWRPRVPQVARPRLTPLNVLLGCLALGLLVASASVAISHPPTAEDVLGYHGALSVFFWEDGTLSTFLDRFPDVWTLGHPGLAELWFGLLRVGGGEPLAVLGQLPFIVLASVAITALGRRLGLSLRAAVLGGLALLLAPMLAIQVGVEMNDVVATALVTSLAALIAVPDGEWSVGRAALVGLGLGVMAVTKVDLLPAVAALGVAFLVALVRHRRWSGARAPDARGRNLLPMALAAAAACFLVAVGPWWIRDLLRWGNPVYPTNLPLYGHGISQTLLSHKDAFYVPSRLLWPLFPIIEPLRLDSGLGATFAVALIPGGVMALRRARRWPLAIIGLVLLFHLPIWWLETRHQTRMLVAEVSLLFPLVPFALAGLRPRLATWSAVLLGVAATLSAGLTVTAALAPAAALPVDRTAFYSHQWNADPAVLTLPESDGLLVDVGCGQLGHVYPLLGPGQRRSVASLPCGASEATILDTMHRYRLTYAFVTVHPKDDLDLAARYPASAFALVEHSTRIRRRTHHVERYLYQLLPGA
jgi:hypothetical protein